MLTLRSHSVAETKVIAAALARLVAVNDVILLHGEMGAGKTAFAQGFGEGLGVDEPVTSPTFNLVHTYDTGRVVFHHADLYRLDRMAELSDLALGELVEDDGVLVVEWGEAAADLLGDHLDIRLETATTVSDTDGDAHDDARTLTFDPVGPSWTRRWPKIEAALRPWKIEFDGVAGESDLSAGGPC